MAGFLLDELHTRLRRQSVRAVTFDVFDTFLFRGCTKPDGVFELAARRAPASSASKEAVESYVQHRQLAEAKAHCEALKSTGSFEIPIEDIYARFPMRLFGMSREAIPELIRIEFQAELDLCFVNPDIAALYAEVQRLGLKLGFISDTYWNADRLGALLRCCEPGLHWDFLYASCDHGTGKSDKLFGRFLAEQRLAAADVLHIGDNAGADIEGARRFGISSIHVPQASHRLSAVLQRERTAQRILVNETRLDHGLCAVRRMTAARDKGGDDSFRLGVEVLGPIMASFDRFVAERVARMRSPDKNIAVAFLARDGMLSFETWRACRSDSTYYVEINRRVALIGAATDLESLSELLGRFPAVDERTIEAILKVQSSRISAFFRGRPAGRCSGKDFADAMPDLFDPTDCETLVARVRQDLLVYLRNTISDFDSITDLVLVDLGYAGSIQKALRRIFDLEGIRKRLHGLYLLSFDDAFAEFPDTDTAEGFISDLIVKPRVSRILARNITILEHACCAPEGSVRGYKAGLVLREPDPRPRKQLDMCTEIQAGVLHYVKHANTICASAGIDPFLDLREAASRAAAILARFLLLPTDEELLLLGGMKHDVNLGTQTLVPTADPLAVDRLNTAFALPTFCAAPEPPMWIAGTLNALSPAHGFLYALFGAGHLPPDIFADAKCGSVDVMVISAAATRSISVSCFRTGFGEVRLRIPVPRAFGAVAISVPLTRIAPEGLLAGITLQTGKTIAEAMFDREVKLLPWTPQHAIGIAFSGTHYRAVAAVRHDLLIKLPVLRGNTGLVTLLIKPLTESRVVAVNTVAGKNEMRGQEIDEVVMARAGTF